MLFIMHLIDSVAVNFANKDRRKYSISCDSKGVFEKENNEFLVVCSSVASRQDSLCNFSQNVGHTGNSRYFCHILQ